MARIDWSQDSTGLPPQGNYPCEIVKAHEGPSKSSGEPMFTVEWHDLEGKKVCLDYIMLGGKGWATGKAKLAALGFTEADTDSDAFDLIGKRATVTVIHETRQYVGRDGTNREGTNAKIDGLYTPVSKDDTPF